MYCNTKYFDRVPLTLTVYGTCNSVLFCTGWTLRFTLGPSLQPYKVHLFCNHPLSGQPFDRNTYNELTWTCLPGQQCDDADRFANIEAHTAGSFHFYVTYKDGGQLETE